MVKGDLSEIHQRFQCVEAPAMETLYPANCSADYLAAIQWGASAVTNSTYIANPDAPYFPKSLSVEAWNIPGVVGKPEYFAYSSA